MTHRVLFVDAAQCFGGAQRSLMEVLTHLDQTRVKPLLLGVHDAPDGLLHTASRNAIPFEKLTAHTWERTFDGIMKAAKDILKARPIIRDLCAQHEIDLIYANGIQAGLLCAIDKPPDVPFVFHHRDVLCPTQALRYVAKRAKSTLVGSQFVRERTLEQLDGRHEVTVELLENGLDFEGMDERAQQVDYRAQFTVPADHKMVVMLADMVEWKRHGLFLEALDLACEADPTVHGYLVGGARDPAGFLLEELLIRQVEKMDRVERIIMTGTVVNPYPLIKAADCVVSVAEDEPFGRSVAEALAFAKPVVAVPGGGPQEIGGGSKALVLAEPRPKHIADGILDALAVSAEDRAAAAERTRQMYGLSRHLDSLYTIIDTHARPGGTPAGDAS